MTSNVFFIDEEFSRKMSKNFVTFLEENISTKNKQLILVVDSIGGESADATLMSYMLRKYMHNFETVTVIILMNCASAAFDFVASIKDLARIKVVRSASFMTHAVAFKDIPSDIKAQREFKRAQKSDLDATIKRYGPVLTQSQILTLKKGFDVYLGTDQAVKLLNAEII